MDGSIPRETQTRAPAGTDGVWGAGGWFLAAPFVRSKTGSKDTAVANRNDPGQPWGGLPNLALT